MRRLLAGAGVAMVLLAVLPAPSLGQAAEPAGYDFFTAAGVADGITTQLSVKDFLAVEDFVGLSSVSAEARLESGRSTALAVLPDPGDLLLGLPGTLAGLAGVPGIPDYPAAARAEHPTAPRQEKNFVPDGGLGALRLLAEADDAHALGRAGVTDFVDTVGVLPGFSVGSVRSESMSRRLDSRTYEARATTTTNDIRLLGGLMRIGQLTTLVTARVEDGKATAKVEDTRISGAEVAGTPVGIDAGGLTAPNGSQALQPVVDQIAAPLADSGYTITVTPGSVTNEGGKAQASSGTLRIEYRTLVQGAYPTTFAVSFGRSQVTVEAGGTADDASVLGADGGADLGGLGTDLSGGTDTGAAGVLGSSLGAAGDTLGALPTAGGASGGVATAGRPAAAVTDLMDFRSLYRLMAFATVALVAARFWAVARAGRRPAASRPNLRTMWRW
jgi:hypothetical protein